MEFAAERFAAESAGALRPAQRARLLRRRLRGRHQGPEVACHRAPGLENPGQSRPPGRRRRRPAGGRRRGLHDPDPRRPVARLGAQGSGRPAGARPLRRRHVLPAAGRGGAEVRGQAPGAFRAGRGPEAFGLAATVPTDCTGLGKGGDRAHGGDPHGDRGCAAPSSPTRMPSSARSSPSASRPRTRWSISSKKHKLPGLAQLYMPSFSTRTVVYKGLLLAPQVESFYEDLRNPLTESALCLVHQRFSTNTFHHGDWRIPTASSPITARSTRCAAM